MDNSIRLGILIILLAAFSVAAMGVLLNRSTITQNTKFASGNVANSTIVIKATSNGYNVSNISRIDPFTIVMNGSAFKLYVSYITYTSAGVWLNGSVHQIFVNKPVIIRETLSNLFYAKLTNASYLAKIPTVNIYFYYTSVPLTPVVNLTYNLAANVPTIISVPNAGTTITLESTAATSLGLAVFNYTSIIKTAPPSYRAIEILNISPSTQANLAISLAMKYLCASDTNALLPYKLMANGTWVEISNFSFNTSACTISFIIPPDPIVGLFQYQPGPTTVSTTAPTTSISSLTTIATTTITQKSNPYTPQILVIIIAVIIIAIVYYFINGKKGKKSRQQK